MGVGEIHHVALSVRDLERSIAFYRDGLGMRMTLEMPVRGDSMTETLRLARGTTGRSVYLQGPQRIGQVELIQWDLPVPADSKPKEIGDPGIFILSFNVERDELQALYDKLVSMGVECNTPPRRNTLANYGEIGIFVCRDPDGNMVEIVNLPSREEIKAFRAKGLVS